jgi:hypothetical protein
MNNQEIDNFLKHWGVLGMHWGHRNHTSTSVVSKDHTDKMELKKKRISEMSNDELVTLNKRMQLEKQYKELASNDISAGQKFVNGLLNQAVKELNTYAMKQVSTKIEAILKSKTGK